MCFRVLLATACFAVALHAQTAPGSCPIQCVNGECKPISSPGHEGHYICECTPPFTGDSCSVQSAAATSSPQSSASRTPQPSARSTPQPTAVGLTAVEGSSDACPIECVHGECKPISSPGHEGHYICECQSPFQGDSCNVQPTSTQSTPLMTPAGTNAVGNPDTEILPNLDASAAQSSDDLAQNQTHGHLSTGNIVGIVLGAVGGAIVLGVAATFVAIAWTRNRRLPRLKESQPSFPKFEDASTQV